MRVRVGGVITVVEDVFAKGRSGSSNIGVTSQ